MSGVPVTGVSELVLEVVDLEAAEEFYAGVLGLPVVERWPDREAIWVMAGERTRSGCGARRWASRAAAADCTCTTPCTSRRRASTQR